MLVATSWSLSSKDLQEQSMEQACFHALQEFFGQEWDEATAVQI